MASLFITLQHPSGRCVRVSQGFSWPALVLGSVWAVVRRAWLLAAVFLAVDIALWILGGYAAGAGNTAGLLAFVLASIFFAVVRGMYGNRWLMSALRRGGYTPVGSPVRA
ncbi:MAG: DUF2628 domain-containing protein [Polaromonas sp.]|nr:DUF2628 domain-containing protein [Polaromonas sp.]